jgi:hypothetical protein
VNQLRKKQVLLTFKISTGKDDVAIIMLKEYQDLIEKSREHLHSMKIERNDQQETVDSKCRALSRFLYALKDLNTSPLAISLTLFIEKFLKLKSARHLSMSQRVRIIPKSLDEETIRHDIQYDKSTIVSTGYSLKTFFYVIGFYDKWAFYYQPWGFMRKNFICLYPI